MLRHEHDRAGEVRVEQGGCRDEQRAPQGGVVAHVLRMAEIGRVAETTPGSDATASRGRARLLGQHVEGERLLEHLDTLLERAVGVAGHVEHLELRGGAKLLGELAARSVRHDHVGEEQMIRRDAASTSASARRRRR